MVTRRDLNMDNREDSTVSDSINPPPPRTRKEPSSMGKLNVLERTPEKKFKKEKKETSSTQETSSSSNQSRGNSPEKARKRASASPRRRNKQKFVNRSAAPLVHDRHSNGSPKKGHGTESPTAAPAIVVQPTKSLSKLGTALSTNQSVTRGKSPSKMSSCGKGASQISDNLKRDKRKSPSSHRSTTAHPRHSAISQTAQPLGTFATRSNDVIDSTTIVPGRSMHKSGGVVGSMVNLMDTAVSQSTPNALPTTSRYGLREQETTSMDIDLDSVTDSCFDMDMETRGDKGVESKKTTARNDSKKRTPENNNAKGFHAPKVTQRTLVIEKQPHMALVVVWCLVLLELTFDFASTGIAFQSLKESICCGYRINLGRLPVAITVPFFILLMGEYFFMFLTITLTLWPSIVNMELEGCATTTRLLRPFRCCLKWNATAVLRALNFTVILNPCFECVFVWMLLYQSDQSQCFLVLGLEGIGIVLHFVSVWLEGTCRSFKSFCFHSLQLIPFLISVLLILFYLREGGICYLVEGETFAFTGCELCPNEFPPVDGVCQMGNGTNVTLVGGVQGDVTDLSNRRIVSLVQGTYCGNYDHDGPDENFCFFEYY